MVRFAYLGEEVVTYTVDVANAHGEELALEVVDVFLGEVVDVTFVEVVVAEAVITIDRFMVRIAYIGEEVASNVTNVVDATVRGSCTQRGIGPCCCICGGPSRPG